ncbi:uncharacterized protein LOC115627215 [Scaptodrosophila lebanonensis]|uniref:Uncharacterized protein LOC115627215 n=1 Tax=Drosophila lebanonensis TaxID=7225 RepID=A0A6J2TSZ9_DROLE|nr:uncharacterized protein LOC115627215 [Scaptodrosophila lebanonensis]
MSAIKNCLKISYQGELNFIICDAGQSYMEIMALASFRFNIPTQQRRGLVLTNGQGYVFEPKLFECFLLLFPCPEMVFYLRLDWNKLRRAVTEHVETATLPLLKRRREQPAEADGQQQSAVGEEEEEFDYVAVPVYRQNAFFGVFPKVLCERQCQQLEQTRSRSAQDQARRSHQQNQHNEEPQAKRIRLMLHRKPRESLDLMRTTTSSSHRFIRI